MKQIKKLSTKLLLVLGVMILSVTVWQVIVSKRVIGDMVKICRSQSQSTEQIHELLKSGELKTYHPVPCRPFSKIKLNGVNAHILKGKEYEVYVSDYYKRYVEVEIIDDELFLNSFSGLPTHNHNTPVFIFMPEDPQLVYYKPDTSQFQTIFEIHGFKGENTLLWCEGIKGCEKRIVIVTDMPYINVNQKESSLKIFTSRLDSTIKTNCLQVNAHVENGKFYFDDRISDSINVNIQLQESVIEGLRINSMTKVGTLSVQGSLHKRRDRSENYYIYDYRDIEKMEISYPGQCDSLLIQLTSDLTSSYQLWLAKGLSGRFENIDCTNNVVVVRMEE